MPIEFRNGVEVVQCPCCKGCGYLVVWHEFPGGAPTEHHHVCTHCMGHGHIPAERKE